eukprot:1798360-Pyramimonas_sp.AAC.1
MPQFSEFGKHWLGSVGRATGSMHLLQRLRRDRAKPRGGLQRPRRGPQNPIGRLDGSRDPR